MKVQTQLQQKIGTLLETKALDSHVARTGILGQDCVLLQVRHHGEERKRSRDATIGEPRTL